MRSATEMLGLDPMELANEGVAVMVVEDEKAETILKILKNTKQGTNANIIGEVKEGPSRVIMETEIGGKRIIREPYGSPMPRIC